MPCTSTLADVALRTLELLGTLEPDDVVGFITPPLAPDEYVIVRHIITLPPNVSNGEIDPGQAPLFPSGRT